MRQRVRFGRPKPARKPVSTQLTVTIDNLSHEGRGIARVDGKTLFVKGALPNETVLAQIDKSHRRYDEGHLINLEQSSAERVEPHCKHFGQCGGCQLQHLQHDKQIEYKQQWVLDQLLRQGQTAPEQIETPLRSGPLQYRRAARIGINQRQDGTAIVGFRRSNSNRIEAIEHCPILDQRANALFTELTQLLNQYPEQIKRITHAELAFGDECGALTLRVMKGLDSELQNAFVQLSGALNCNFYLDRGDQVDAITEKGVLSFNLASFDQTLQFAPGDFIQVNGALNQLMIDRAIEWLDPQPDERVLDLFCGLGNFTLPLASRAAEVIGVEGSKEMVIRGKQNAALNNRDNCHFEAADLTQPISQRSWFKQGFDKALIDPPRTGALEVIQQLVKTPIKQLLYVSCNPSALARDSQVLREAGFKLQRFCVMDMFPHTTHVESLALFIRD